MTRFSPSFASSRRTTPSRTLSASRALSPSTCGRCVRFLQNVAGFPQTELRLHLQYETSNQFQPVEGVERAIGGGTGFERSAGVEAV